jgi:eukaryotic-like serine/threonine-protein kinase
MSLTPGTRLGPYEIQAAIGAGGMGQVYLAHDTRLNRNVALKSLTGPSVDTPEARDRLLREARAAARLTHPNIAAIHDILDTAPCPCIVMEYVEGETLAAKIARGPLECTQALAIGVQLADALAQAHAAGLVHRDLKPANVQITPDGVAKILDFGVASSRRLEDASVPDDAPTRDVAQTQAGRLTGTPAYMAPEQLMGRPATPQSDVYSLGVVLFEALSGCRPFEAPDFVHLALAILSDPTPTLRGRATGTPQEVSALVARAMAKKPADRHTSAAAVAVDLRRAAQTVSDRRADASSSAGTPGNLLRLVRTRLGWRRLAAAAATVVVVLLALAAVAVWKNRETAPGTGGHVAPNVASNVAIVPLLNVTGDSAKDFVGVGVSEWLTAALAGVASVNVISRDDRGRSLASGADAARIRRDEGAALVVGGSVQQADAELRFTIKIVRPDDSVAWAREYGGPMRERLEIYKRMADEVAAQLGVPVTAADRARFTRGPSASPDAFDDYSLGRTLLDREDIAGNTDKAIAAFERAIKKDSSFVLARAGLADACWAQFHTTRDAGWAGRALDAIQAAMKLDPDDPDVRISLAGMYAETGRTKDAIDEFRAALARRPTNDGAHRQLAVALRNEGRPDEALQEYQQALAIRPNYFRNNSALGVFYYRRGQYAEAAIAFQRVTENQPDSSWGFVNLGAAYLKSGDNRRALENFERAIKIAPDEAAYSNVGTIHYAEGRYAEAARAFEEAIKLGPNNDISHRNLGDALLKLGQRDRARAEYERAAALSDDLLKVNPRDGPTLASHGVYEAKAGRTADAIRHAEAAVTQSPGDVEVLYKRAVVYALAGRDEDAARSLEIALTLGYSRAQVRSDDDVSRIVRLPRIQELLKEGK